MTERNYSIRNRLYDLVRTPRGRLKLLSLAAGGIATGICLTLPSSRAPSHAAGSEKAAAVRLYDSYSDVSASIARTILREDSHDTGTFPIDVTDDPSTNTVEFNRFVGKDWVRVELNVSAQTAAWIGKAQTIEQVVSDYDQLLADPSDFTVQEVDLSDTQYTSGNEEELAYFGNNNWAEESSDQGTVCADGQGVNLSDGTSYYANCSPSSVAETIGFLSTVSDSVLGAS